MPTKLSDLTAQINIADDDILHVRTNGGIDHKITGYNARKELSRKIVQVTTKTVLATGDPVCYSGGKYGKYKIEKLLAQTQALVTGGSANFQYGACITKDEQTGNIGFVVWADNGIRMGRIDDAGTGATFLTPEILGWSTNAPNGFGIANRGPYTLIGLPGGRLRFFIKWQIAGPVNYARIGEWDGATGINWLTPEYVVTYPVAVTDEDCAFVKEEDPQFIFLITVNITNFTLYAQVLQFSGGVLSSYVAQTALATGAIASVLYGASYMGDGYFSVVWHASNTSSAIVTARLTTVPSVVLVKSQQVVAASWGVRYYGRTKKLGARGNYWGFVTTDPGATTRKSYYGDWNQGGEITVFPGNATYTKLTHKNATPAFQTNIQDDWGYEALVHGLVVAGDAVYFELFRYAKGLGFPMSLMFSTLIAGATGYSLAGADLKEGILLALVWGTAVTTDIEIWRVPKCVGISLASAIVDDVVRVLVSGADDSFGLDEPDWVFEWDPMSGLFLPGDHGFDVRLRKLPDDGVMVEQI